MNKNSTKIRNSKYDNENNNTVNIYFKRIYSGANQLTLHALSRLPFDLTLHPLLTSPDLPPRALPE